MPAGRPSLPVEIRRVPFMAQLPPAVLAQLKERAKLAGVSVSRMAAELLERSLSVSSA